MGDIRRLETERLALRIPAREDAQAIYDGWASDAMATKFMGWPRHESLADTDVFLGMSDADWEKWGVGPYLIELAETGEVIGSTGLTLESPDKAMVGYILSPAQWGKGYATEALKACMGLARSLDIEELYAPVHPDNTASQHVLVKCGFVQNGTTPYVFFNLEPTPVECPVYTWSPDGSTD